MSVDRQDSYRGAGIKSGTSFSLSDHDISAQPDQPLDSLTAEFMKLEAGSETAAVGRVHIARPDFVDAGDSINTTRLRTFVVDSSNRVSQKYVPGSDTNFFRDEAMLPIVVWVTGIAPQPGQSAQDYFDAVSPENSMLESVKSQGDAFAEQLRQGLIEIARKGGEVPLADSGLTLAQVIRRDPVNTCRLMIDTISPAEGIGALVLAPALLNFKHICQEPQQ